MLLQVTFTFSTITFFLKVDIGSQLHFTGNVNACVHIKCMHIYLVCVCIYMYAHVCTYILIYIYIHTHSVKIRKFLNRESCLSRNISLAQLVKNLPAMWETWIQCLGWENPLEKGKATHSSILTWRIP